RRTGRRHWRQYRDRQYPRGSRRHLLELSAHQLRRLELLWREVLAHVHAGDATRLEVDSDGAEPATGHPPLDQRLHAHRNGTRRHQPSRLLKTWYFFESSARRSVRDICRSRFGAGPPLPLVIVMAAAGAGFATGAGAGFGAGLASVFGASSFENPSRIFTARPSAADSTSSIDGNRPTCCA